MILAFILLELLIFYLALVGWQKWFHFTFRMNNFPAYICGMTAILALFIYSSILLFAIFFGIPSTI